MSYLQGNAAIRCFPGEWRTGYNLSETALNYTLEHRYISTQGSKGILMELFFSIFPVPSTTGGICALVTATDIAES